MNYRRGSQIRQSQRFVWPLISTLLLFGLSGSSFASSQQAAPPALSVTPTSLVLLVGETAELSLIDGAGQPVKNAQWSIDYPVAEVTPADEEVQLKGLRSGRARLTAETGNQSASATISVLTGDQLPATTVRWSLAPTPGYKTLEVRQAEPTSGSLADFFSIEWSPSAGTMIRGLRSTGQQLWSTHLSISSNPRTIKAWTRLPMGVTTMAGKTLDHVQQALLTEQGFVITRNSEQSLQKQLPLEGQMVLAHDEGDGFGGLLLLEFGHTTDSIVDLSGSDGSERWHYSSSGYLNQEYTVNPQGDIGIVETQASPPGTALLILDGQTGAVRYRVPFPNSSTTVRNLKCVSGNDLINVRPARAGSVFTNSDGNMYVQVEVHNEMADTIPCEVGQYVFDDSLSLLRVTPDGETEWKRFVELHSDANGKYVAQPRFFAGESIPDGLGGALAAWNCIFPGAPGGVKPHMEARLTRLGASGQFDYALPMPGWSIDPTALWYENMVLGEEDTLYATNKHAIVSFNIPLGQVKWVRNPPTGEIAIDWSTRGGVLLTNDGRLDHFDMDGNGVALPWTVKTTTSDAIGLVQFDPFDHSPMEPLRLRDVQLYGAGSFLAVEDGPPDGHGALIQFVLPTH